MPATTPAEAKTFRLLGHDASAAWGGGSLVQIHKGHAYVGAVGGSSYNGPEGFTVHDVRDPTAPKKVGEFRAPPGIHCHKLRIVGDDLLYVNSERLVGAKANRLLRHARLRPAPLRRRSQARPCLHAQRRAGLEQTRDLDARYPR